jgi:hypothetical protein
MVSLNINVVVDVGVDVVVVGGGGCYQKCFVSSTDYLR